MLLFNRQTRPIILSASLLVILFCIVQANGFTAYKGRMILNDNHLKAESIFSGIKFPTSMAFLGPNDILVLEKNNGTVQRIINGTLSPKPLLDVNVATRSERGMLGIAVAKHEDIPGSLTYVFLYFTESADKDDSDISEGKVPLGNRLYRYELSGDRLVNPKLLLDLPAKPGPAHNSGKIAIGPDGNVYVVVGDLGYATIAQNNASGSNPDGRGGILRVTQDGAPVGKGLLGNTHPLNLYFGYGIRNSFGIDFDPVTGKLWDTENGPDYGDEINLVEPGFNSGWNKVQGMWQDNKDYIGEIAPIHPEGLVNFNGKGNYSMPEFTWNRTVGVTALSFLGSDKLGKQYENDLFVGDFHNGNVYDFKLNQARNKFDLNTPLADRIANNEKELQSLIFAQGFGAITDIKVGPDGYLYLLSIQQGGADCPNIWNLKDDCVPYDSGINGMIFRIVRAN